MATFRNGGLELETKASLGELTTPIGDRFTIYAAQTVSPSGRTYSTEIGKQIWVVDSSGNTFELSNQWLETKVAETSGKLDYIYPAVSQFMSAGLLFLNSSISQTISSDINYIGNISTSGNIIVNQGSFIVTDGAQATFDGPITAYDDFSVYGNLQVNQISTINTFNKIIPFFVRASSNRIHPAGYSDPRILTIGDNKIYNEFKQTDRGLRFTVLRKDNLQIIHDEVYDTAGSQFRSTDLAFKMFSLMNNSQNIGILNSRESWESIINRQVTCESVGLSAISISAAYSNLIVGSLLNQFERFGLSKAIRAAQTLSEDSVSNGGSSYCAIFQGSDIVADTVNISANINLNNKSIESWVPRSNSSLPFDGEQQKAELAGWLMQPKQLAPENNISDLGFFYVTSPVGKENDAILETCYVSSKGISGSYNIKVDGKIPNQLTYSFASPTGVINLTNHKIIELATADYTKDHDAVNVDFTSQFVTPIGCVLDSFNETIPANFLPCDSTAYDISSQQKLFTAIKFNCGFVANATIQSIPSIIDTTNTLNITGTRVFITSIPITAYDPTVTINYPSGNYIPFMTGTISSSAGINTFRSGKVIVNAGSSMFVTNEPNDISVNVTKFKVPDYRGKTSIGAGLSYVVDISGNYNFYAYQIGENGGVNRVKLSIDEMPKHSHTIKWTETGNSGGSGDTTFFGNNLSTETTSAGKSFYHENMMPFIAVNKIIRAK